MQRKLTLLLTALLTATLFAQTPLEKGTLPTLIAPGFFGPNAFAVPEMTDGSTHSQLTLDVAGDGYFGYAGDRTATIFGKIYIPLFTDRVNLVIWMPIYEWWQNTPQRQTECRIDGKSMSGNGAGDAYVSTDIMVLREKKRCPAITLRAALRSASGEDYVHARFYDSPGYFLDGTVGKSFMLKNKLELRTAVSAGFLCWQTANSRQNDAVMYGALLSLRHEYVSATIQYSGYAGWENKGDCPMIIKAQLRGNIPIKKAKTLPMQLEPFAEYQYGIKDYPFHMLRIGLGYSLDILSLQNKK